MSKSPWTDLHARLHRTLKERQLLPAHSRILIALSGGQDSLCLAQLLIDLQSRWDWHVTIAHCDHHWELDAGIVDRVRSIVVAWENIELLVETASNLAQTEAAARAWRYQALVKMAIDSNSTHIVTAHTQSDRAETLLYNLIRGAGADGLSALNWVRELQPGLKLVRPLLEIDRSTTHAFCQERQLPVWVDAYNQDFHYARVRLRERIIPQLKSQFHPQVEKHLARTAEILRGEAEYLDILATEVYTRSTQDTPAGTIDRQLLKSQPLALQRRVIKKWLAECLTSTPSFDAIEATIELIDAPQGTKTSTLGAKMVAVVRDGYIAILSNSIDR